MEPRNVGKILGCILLREPDEDETVQLAYGNDATMHGNINNAKATRRHVRALLRAAPPPPNHHHAQGRAPLPPGTTPGSPIPEPADLAS
jgi:hypothetical protein